MKRGTGPSRRAFLKTALAAGVAGASIDSSAAQQSESKPLEAQRQSASAGQSPSTAKLPIRFPRRHTGRQLARVSCPLGGIGTGGIGLGGRGNLQDWQIFNRADIGNALEYSFGCMYVKQGSAAPYSVVLERRLLPPYDLTQEGLGFANVPGLPRLNEATFLGSFPTARVEFEDVQCPVNVALDVFSPFQPVDADASGLPCTVLTYEVKNPSASAVEVVIAWSMSNPVTASNPAAGASDSRLNEIRSAASMSGLFMSNPGLRPDDPMLGSFALAALSSANSRSEQLARWRGGSNWRVGPQHFWFDNFRQDGRLGEQVEPSSPIGSVSIRQTIAPGATGKFRFLLAWHFPNRTPERCGWAAPAGKSKDIIGNWYATRFPDAWAVAEHVQQNIIELEGMTRAFVEALKESTLPDVVKEAASANLSTLVSNTSFRIADGSFQGFEGCGDHRGLGFGTCTHVWNYEVATQFVFPSLARSMRETSFSYVTNSVGHMDFRHKLPPSDEYWGAAAADGQMGQIVKLYFDWILFGDDDWLRKLWPTAKRALAYAWRPGGWDERKFGVMDGVQHNTYDIEFFGPNPMCSSWYLAALRATALMADAMGDQEFATECRVMADQGRNWIDANLFNGEYYIQKIRPIPQDKIALGLQVGMGTKDTLHPQFQVGDGCLVDQLIGQYMATIAGLGDLLDSNNIRKTLAAIYKYNYKRDLRNHASVQRVYALNDEAALVICDFTRGTRPEVPMPYYAEIMTGYEYSAAVLMLANGMIDEGVECISNIRHRYDGEKANPYDETEYGRHYARAMASWAAIPILSGFRWDGRKQRLSLEPLLHNPEFRSFWSAPSGWGEFSVNQASKTISVQAGSLTLKEFRINSLRSKIRRVNVRLAAQEITPTLSADGCGSLLTFAQPITVAPQRTLEIALTAAS